VANEHFGHVTTVTCT